jgi:hypothetical protein
MIKLLRLALLLFAFLSEFARARRREQEFVWAFVYNFINYEGTFMATIYNFLSQLSPGEKLAAIEFLWSNLEFDVDELPSPEWHADVIRDRIANPSPQPALLLEDAMTLIKERVRARQNPS